MNRQVMILFLLAGVLVPGVAFYLFAHDAGTEKKLELRAENGCYSCHDSESRAERAMVRRGASASCNYFCTQCHDNTTGHHPVRVENSIADKSRLPHLSNSEVGCITCHNIAKERFSSEPMAAQSLFDSLFRRKDQYRTYYLTADNSDGGLCLSCHK